jgi:hypothetical protein
MDVIIQIKSGSGVLNTGVTTGVLPGGQHNSRVQGINQQVPYSGEVRLDGTTITDDGLYAQKYKDPQATKVKFY